MQLSVRAGFTIVEAIVAITILLLVASSLIVLLNQGFGEIFVAGYRISVLHGLQKDIDAEFGRVGSGEDDLEINVGGRTIEIRGEEFEREEEIFKSRKTSITIFISGFGED